MFSAIHQAVLLPHFIIDIRTLGDTVPLAVSLIHCSGVPGLRCKDGLGMVGTAPQQLKWMRHPASNSRDSDGDGCYQD